MKPITYRRAWHERRFFQIRDSSNRVEDLIFKSSVSCVPSRNTGQGANRYDKFKPLKVKAKGNRVLAAFARMSGEACESALSHSG